MEGAKGMTQEKESVEGQCQSFLGDSSAGEKGKGDSVEEKEKEKEAEAKAEAKEELSEEEAIESWALPTSPKTLKGFKDKQILEALGFSKSKSKRKNGEKIVVFILNRSYGSKSGLTSQISRNMHFEQ